MDTGIKSFIIQTLSESTRSELRDHYFCDREISWWKDSEEVASAYLGRNDEFHFDHQGTTYTSDNWNEIKEFVKLGQLGKVSRNDSTGEDTYRGA
ncbi:MAG: hypothetical protein M0R77_00355 [Gammaproteobacteria bacterium]|nr:hypothetical protein [Acholeplasmataceae bacterium]MCK9529005.1 hypothetical protein [Gammaproteobacteria bacterium]